MDVLCSRVNSIKWEISKTGSKAGILFKDLGQERYEMVTKYFSKYFSAPLIAMAPQDEEKVRCCTQSDGSTH